MWFARACSCACVSVLFVVWSQNAKTANERQMLNEKKSVTKATLTHGIMTFARDATTTTIRPCTQRISSCIYSSQSALLLKYAELLWQSRIYYVAPHVVTHVTEPRTLSASLITVSLDVCSLLQIRYSRGLYSTYVSTCSCSCSCSCSCCVAFTAPLSITTSK